MSDDLTVDKLERIRDELEAKLAVIRDAGDLSLGVTSELYKALERELAEARRHAIIDPPWPLGDKHKMTFLGADVVIDPDIPHDTPFFVSEFKTEPDKRGKSMSMDEETRKSLETLIEEGKTRRASPLRGGRIKTPHRSTWEAPRTAPPEPTPEFEFAKLKPEPVRANPILSFNGSSVETVASVADHVAILSMNTAKACIVMNAPVTAALVNDLKNLHNNGNVKYNNKDKVWEFLPTLLPQLRLLLKSAYKDVHVMGVQKQIKATKFDQLIAKLTKEDKQKIYVMLATKYHPDKGGDKDTMTLINLVFKGGD